MIFAKERTYGLETVVKRIQNQLANIVWFKNVTINDIHIYGIIERTIRDNNLIPEAYIGDNEYQEIFIDDKLAATIGFLVLDRTVENNSQFVANMDVIFTVNLEEIHGNALRDKDKALLEAYRELDRSGVVIEITDKKERNSEVFSEFNQDRIVYRDMQPYYVFSYNISVNYLDDWCD